MVRMAFAFSAAVAMLPAAWVQAADIGQVKVAKGTARGYEPGAELKDVPKPSAKPEPAKPADLPKPAAKPDEKKPDPPKVEEKKPTDPAAAEDEKSALTKLEAAKKLIADGKPADAKPLLKYVVKFFPKTSAATDAKKLLEENK